MRLVAVGCLILVAAVALVGAQESRKPASARSFSDYNILLQRNIFSAKRRAPVVGTRSTGPVSTAPTIETVTLVGVVLRDTGNIAIFASALSSESGSRNPGESVAGFRIDEIRTTSITMTRDEKKLEWTVGGILRRIDGGDWYLPEAPGAASDITADPAAEAAILKRMRARRAQEASNE
ncbi:hypothetical protein GC173_05875 [bacterium]|nr:hypothetical protein [bacterium]